MSSAAQFLAYNLSTDGSRSLDNALATKIVLTAVCGDLENNVFNITAKEIRTCLNIPNWRASFSEAATLRAELDSVEGGSSATQSAMRVNYDNERQIRLQKIVSHTERKIREDAVDRECFRQSWHDHCPINTNTDKKVGVKTSHNKLVTCSSREKHETAREIYEKVLVSTEFQAYSIANQRYSYDTNEQGEAVAIPFSKCPCIEDVKRLDCADTVRVGVMYALKTIQKIKQRHKRRVNDKLDSLHQSVTSLTDYLVCERVTYDHVKRPVAHLPAPGPPDVIVAGHHEDALVVDNPSTPGKRKQTLIKTQTSSSKKAFKKREM